MRMIRVLAVSAAWLCFAGPAGADGAAFTAQVRQLTQQYARAVGQCQSYAPESSVGRDACLRVQQYSKHLRAAGWEPKIATQQLFEGCKRFESAYLLAAVSRENREPPETALKRLKADKWLRIGEPGLKSIINIAYFEDWAVLLIPEELARVVGNQCRYGSEPKWKPLK